MGLQLPIAFTTKMQQLLGDEYEEFLASYEKPRYAGIRINTLKIDVESFRAISPFELKPIPWCKTGFYVEESLKPGKHPYYHAGLYYIQEPSAMAPVEVLDVHPGDRVLDLCAAPGGKSTQIAAKLSGQGLLVTNDISAERTKALAKNIELNGVRNAIVLNETPERIADRFPQFFNRILIDAPCSGEGMFRKDEEMARQWEKRSLEQYTNMQHDILHTAARMLSPGGRIVYSTCTFSPEENEAIIAGFLQEYEDYEVIPLPGDGGFAPGRADWLVQAEGLADLTISQGLTAEAAAKTDHCGRLWPHQVDGEGHFLAILQHQGPVDPSLDLTQYVPNNNVAHSEDHAVPVKKGKIRPYGRAKGARTPSKPATNDSELLAGWEHFRDEQLRLQPAGEVMLYGTNLYISPLSKERLNGLRTVRSGWYIGSVKNGRFTPAHPLATALKPGEASRILELSVQDGEAVRYLKGETLEIQQSRISYIEDSGPKGFVLVTAEGYPLGWGKWIDGILKNEYPAGWRWT
ncbi:RsmF rRNA methyltransferase first C-terminal domain-containing protein [Paenibacillus motobuensis]|uniref:RsmF rRNA methyltransferase first C-terminal domain-containing protein n=1 Tax=Paenibacillus TaxID=44249 RepID=UPI00203E2884|nr:MULTISPECIES: RsmF rRNA methyltransferase first C-terminal domain-containing protein [Paenibacillus]MCM3038508.1 RsmF rRNA methyltransferase first C-terminal domain-containing protein [Paenibacillus lutimineralis]MCM3645612.1 RsmF rRNA methyltransferase first C-terminal domain-containing protein [Paenibacillus motobuensis]